VRGLSVNDWVIPALPGFGTWRKYAVCESDDVDPIPREGVPLELAATISVNPCSAYRMLHDYIQLQPGDLIVQNGANSSVGMAVIQLCKHMGVKTLNVVRDRPTLPELRTRLESLGATVVITEDELANTRQLSEVMKQFGDQKPILGLNCVGGSSASDIARLLKDGSSMVTYGGMSRKPVCIPTGRLIFNDISLRGFWLSRWTETHGKIERRVMINELMNLIKEKEFKTFVQLKPFEQFEEALTIARQGFKDGKVVLTYTP
jgi:trans-2-enoyl-CoA reductase